jgi:hypothetical protein
MSLKLHPQGMNENKLRRRFSYSFMEELSERERKREVEIEGGRGWIIKRSISIQLRLTSLFFFRGPEVNVRKIKGKKYRRKRVKFDMVRLMIRPFFFQQCRENSIRGIILGKLKN